MAAVFGSVSRRLLRNVRKPVFQRTALYSNGASYRQALLNAPETRVSVLSNGLRIASEKSGGSTATVGLWIDSGSRFETEETNGVAHFLEHMVFKGTQKLTKTQLELQIENMGARLDAYTSREQCAYFTQFLSKDISTSVDILSDCVLNPLLDESEIEREREVILRQANEVENQVDKAIFDFAHSMAYQGTPLGRTIYGPSQNIKSITRQNMLDYIATHYTASRMVLAAAGDVDHDALVRMAEKRFSNLPTEVSGAASNLSPCTFTASEMRYRDDDLPLAHVIMAVQGCGWDNPDYFPLMIASTIVGNWHRSQAGGINMASRLAQVCAKEGFANSFSSFNTCYTDTGLWGIYFTADKMTIDDFCFNLQNEWMRLCISLSNFEVEQAKNQFRTNMFMRLNGTTQVCEDIGRQMLTYGRRIPLPELDYRIEQIDAKTVMEVCSKYIYDKCPIVVGVGPIEQLPEYNRIRGKMWWFGY